MDGLSRAGFTAPMTTSQTNSNGLVLVTGGTGKTGRRVAQKLEALGVPVRIGSRSGDPAFDWDDPSSWTSALEGVKAAYLVYYPDLALPGAAETVEAFAKQAIAQGVQHLVLLSGRGEAGARRGEQAVQNAGTDWTIVRASWFCQNFSEDFLLEPVLSGEIALPAGDVAEPFVDADDIADVAVAALTDRRHAGKLYEVTGPRLLSFADAAAEIGKASGRPVHYVPVTPDEYAAGAAEAGVPPDLVGALTDLFHEVLDGRNAYVTDGVQRALGRPARDFADYATTAARTGVWAQ
jgi:uncharacterized protein YbjT (DUF2867 family)